MPQEAFVHILYGSWSVVCSHMGRWGSGRGGAAYGSIETADMGTCLSPQDGKCLFPLMFYRWNGGSDLKITDTR